MNEDIKIVNPIDMPNWDEMILQFPEYSFFHSSSWSKVLQETYNYKPFYFLFERNGVPQAIIPLMLIESFLTGKKGVALPFSDYCPPLVYNELIFHDILQEMLKFGKESALKFLEFRGANDLLKNANLTKFILKHSLDLTLGEVKLFNNLGGNTRRNINKSIREGVTAEISNTRSALEVFYKMNCETRKKHGLPPQPKNFFNNIYKYILSQNKGIIIIGKHNNIGIAGAIYFHLEKKVIYKFGASKQKYLNLRANNLVMWEAIKYYSRTGFSELSMGKTEPRNVGLRRYKLGWNTKESIINIHQYNIKKSVSYSARTSTVGTYNKIFSNLPIPVLKLFSIIFYRHFG